MEVERLGRSIKTFVSFGRSILRVAKISCGEFEQEFPYQPPPSPPHYFTHNKAQSTRYEALYLEYRISNTHKD